MRALPHLHTTPQLWCPLLWGQLTATDSAKPQKALLAGMWISSAWWAQGTVAAGEVVCEQLTGDWVTLFIWFGF